MRRFLLAVFGFVMVLRAEESLTVDQVVADRKLWPREVAVSVPLQVPIIVNGKPSGSMQAPAGRVYPIKSLGPAGVVINAQGSALTVPVTDTDLLARAQGLKAKLKAAPAPSASPQTRSEPPKVMQYPLVGLATLDREYTIVATRDQIVKSPPWLPPGQPLPLSEREAVDLARAHLKTKGFANVELDIISLQRFQDFDDRWYYALSFSDPKAKRKKTDFFLSPYSTVVVFMDRSIPEPRSGRLDVVYE